MASLNTKTLFIALALIAIVVMFQVASAQYGGGRGYYGGGRRHGGYYGGGGRYHGGRGYGGGYGGGYGRGGGYYGGRGYRGYNDYSDMSTYNYDQYGGGGYYDDSLNDDYSSYMDVYSSSPSSFASSSASTSSSTPQTTVSASPRATNNPPLEPELGTPGSGWLNSESTGTSASGLQPSLWQTGFAVGQQPGQFGSDRAMSGYDLITGNEIARGSPSGQPDKRVPTLSGRQSARTNASPVGRGSAGSITAPQVPSSTTTPAPEYVMINPTERKSSTELSDQDE